MVSTPNLLYQKHTTVVAVARCGFFSGDRAEQHRYQRQAVRALLDTLLASLEVLHGYCFCEQALPYTLTKQDSRLFVSFSHSLDQVAVMICQDPCGVDIEKKAVGTHIAERFFHINEKKFLQSHPDALLALWQIKECLAKATNTTLSQTLSQDCLNIYQKNFEGFYEQFGVVSGLSLPT